MRGGNTRSTLHGIVAGILMLAGAATPGQPTAHADAFRLAPWPQVAHSPAFHLVDANGARRTLWDYRGKVVVVFFGFLRCPGVCSAAMHRLALVMKQLGERAARVQGLFITLDPQRDGPKLLKSYLQAFDPHFVSLTGTTAQVNQATSSFHVQYTRVPQGDDYTIAHSTATLILDDIGQLRLVAAVDTPVADLVHDIAELMAEPAYRSEEAQ